MSGTSATSGGNENVNKSPGFLMRGTIKTISLKFPSVKSITTNNLNTWLASPDERAVAVLDCRSVAEYIISHIQGAVDAGHQIKSEEELVKECEAILKGKPNPTIVCYCSVGYRSSDTIQMLSHFYDQTGKQPRPEMFNLEGSLFKWAQEGRPMVDENGQSTQFVHPFNSIFGKLIDKKLRKEKL